MELHFEDYGFENKDALDVFMSLSLLEKYIYLSNCRVATLINTVKIDREVESYVNVFTKDPNYRLGIIVHNSEEKDIRHDYVRMLTSGCLTHKWICEQIPFLEREHKLKEIIKRNN